MWGSRTLLVQLHISTDDEKQQELQTKVAQIAAAVSAEAELPSQKPPDSSDAALIDAGRQQIAQMDCTGCHKFRGQGEELAPDLTGYGSYDWLKGMISNPTHERFYGGNNDRMPSFAEHPDNPDSNIITPANLDLLIRWLRGDWYEPAVVGSQEE